MIWKAFLLALSLVALGTGAEAQDVSLRVRTPIRLPDLPGYMTLKCDFHIHTVFSDGLVWPTVRVEEAWREGLDAIAITDHIEYQRFRADVSTNHNRSYEIAREAGADLNVLVIHGAEITRQMPPGHLNALFLSDANALAVPDWFDALQAARKQGAYIMWNHPGWEAQLIDRRVQWFPEHTRLLEADLMHGIEIVNGSDYYPEPHEWAVAKNLAVLGNTDIHQPINLEYKIQGGGQRPLTLVFARERTVEAIKEALFNRRTAALAAGKIFGDASFLRPLFDGSVKVLNAAPRREKTLLQIHNDSSVDFLLERAAKPGDVSIPEKITLWAGKTGLIEVRGLGKLPAAISRLDLSWRVTNLLTAPNTPLTVKLEVPVADPAPGKNR